jgi:hypothetical protein
MLRETYFAKYLDRIRHQFRRGFLADVVKKLPAVTPQIDVPRITIPRIQLADSGRIVTAKHEKTRPFKDLIHVYLNRTLGSIVETDAQLLGT